MSGAWVRRLAAVGVAAVGVAGLAACEPAGIDLVVNSTADGADAVAGDGVCEMTPGSGDCSLRAAIDEANVLPDHETITFDEGLGDIVLTGAAGDDLNISGDIDITDGVTIDGGYLGAVIAGSGSDRVFDVHGGDPAPFVNLRAITITSGTAAEGAGVRLVGAQQTSIDSSLLRQNVATVAGGAVHVGGGATLSLQNATLSGNASGGAGAAIWSAGTVAMQYSTVAGNWSTTDILHRDASATGGLQVTASLLGTQISATGCGGTITSLGGNVGVSASCGLTNPSDQVVADPKLSALDDHGGPTRTHIPQLDSPAVDAIAEGALLCGTIIVEDARESFRPQFDGCDAGAVEVAPSGGD